MSPGVGCGAPRERRRDDERFFLPEGDSILIWDMPPRIQADVVAAIIPWKLSLRR